MIDTAAAPLGRVRPQRSVLRARTCYSVGGGFVVDEQAARADRIKTDDTVVRYPFRAGEQLLAWTQETGLRISDTRGGLAVNVIEC